MSKRIALALRYDGARYHGWQHQDNVLTVQQMTEQALSRVANHPVTAICAGRTDASVHAAYQVVHFDTEAERSEHAWVFGANSNLPHDISALWAKEVSIDFHARFSARSRTYRYILFNHLIRPGLLRKSVGWYYRKLNMSSMQCATPYLLGEHDFNAFRGSACQAAHAVRTIHRIDITKQQDFIVFEIQANAFVLHMVRNIVGVLIKIGDGDHPPTWAQDVLQSRDRKCASMTIAPQGLYLVAIDYPAIFQLPAASGELFF